MSAPVSASMVESRTTNIFRAEFDEEGVYVYQAFRDSIADYVLAHGRFGGPDFNPARMTWIKPSFACMLWLWVDFGSRRRLHATALPFGR